MDRANVVCLEFEHGGFKNEGLVLLADVFQDKDFVEVSRIGTRVGGVFLEQVQKSICSMEQ